MLKRLAPLKKDPVRGIATIGKGLPDHVDEKLHVAKAKIHLKGGRTENVTAGVSLVKINCLGKWFPKVKTQRLAEAAAAEVHGGPTPYWAGMEFKGTLKQLYT